MGMKEPPGRKGNAASKGQLPPTEQTDKKIGTWKGGELGGNAGHSDQSLGKSRSQGAERHNESKEKTAGTRLSGSAGPTVTRD